MEKLITSSQSTLPPLSKDSLETVDDIKRAVSALQQEQEQLFRSQHKMVSHNSREQGIDKIFEHSCLISMVRRTPYLLGTWPVAIVGSIVNKSVSLGNFESYGSLWRFVRVGETSQDSRRVRVVLECSEIGEKPLYMTNNLELTENNNYAAEWWASKADSKDDFCITLHTVEDKQFLCAHQETSELALVADQAAANQVGKSQEEDESGDTPTPSALFSNYWNFQWAVTSEDAISLSSSKLEDSLSFLDDNVN